MADIMEQLDSVVHYHRDLFVQYLRPMCLFISAEEIPVMYEKYIMLILCSENSFLYSIHLSVLF